MAENQSRLLRIVVATGLMVLMAAATAYAGREMAVAGFKATIPVQSRDQDGNVITQVITCEGTAHVSTNSTASFITPDR